MAGKVPLERLRPQTRAVLAGRDSGANAGAVNPPIHRASTILIDTVAELYGDQRRTYGLSGMPVHDMLIEALCDGRPAAGATLAPSGLAACTLALMSLAEAGGEVLVTDGIYGPTRRFCDRMLARFGVETRYYPPRIGAAIADWIGPATQAVMLESPSSLTFELQDVPAIAAAARARGVATIIDDTWSAGIAFEPFLHGVDLSVQALTKYQAGHADALIGAVIAAEPALARRVRDCARDLGCGPGSPEDAYLALRGWRSLRLRFEAQGAAGLEVARWLERRPEVARVLHPALETHPDHALFGRDFTGAAGVFGCVLKAEAARGLEAMLESLAIFAMGFSWGGYESLIIPCDPQIKRTAEPWRAEGPLLRLSIGLEHPADLIEDLAQGFARL